SGELLVLDSTGREKARHPVAAYGLAYSPVDDAFWIVGKFIVKMNRRGELLSSQPIPDGGYTFTDVVADRERGGAWGLEDNHPDRPRSQCALWKVAPKGEAKAVYSFTEKVLPRTLTCVDGRPWVAALTNYERNSRKSIVEFDYEIQRFDLDGSPVAPLPLRAT